MKSDYLISIAHEIRNPLTNINMSIMGLETEISDETSTFYLDIIRRSSQRISSLITELLLLDKTEGKAKLKYNYSLQQLLDEIIKIEGDRFFLKNATFSKEYSAEDHLVDYNREELRNALSNIIINGLEAITGENGRIIIRTYLQNDKYIIQIEDNGCGINPADIKLIFKNHHTTKSSGMGIGLASAYRFLHSSLISMEVKSDIGRGTQFFIFFNRC